MELAKALVIESCACVAGESTGHRIMRPETGNRIMRPVLPQFDVAISVALTRARRKPKRKSVWCVSVVVAAARLS